MRMSAAEYQKRTAAAPSNNKYGAQRVEVDGITFDSKREARHWMYLRLLERNGKITGLQRQVAIMLEGRDGPIRTRTGRQMRLTVDFVYTDADGRRIHEDAKGAITRDYEVRRAIAAAQGVEVREV